MVGTTRNQQAIEQEYYRVTADVSMSREEQKEAFGEFERWVLEMEGHRLFLNPYMGEWYYYDRVHDSWESTGHHAGTVLFVARSNQLGMVVTRGASGAPLLPAPQSGSPNARFCPQCGHAVRTGARFCRSCGSALGSV